MTKIRYRCTERRIATIQQNPRPKQKGAPYFIIIIIGWLMALKHEIDCTKKILQQIREHK